jgi:hypothetical protein
MSNVQYDKYINGVLALKCSYSYPSVLLTYGNGVSTVKQNLPTNYSNCSHISEQEHHNALSIVFQKVQIQTQKTSSKNNIYYSLEHFQEARHQFNGLRRQTALYNSTFLCNYMWRFWSSDKNVG